VGGWRLVGRSRCLDRLPTPLLRPLH
jgi:hypothetical protein